MPRRLSLAWILILVACASPLEPLATDGERAAGGPDFTRAEDTARRLAVQRFERDGVRLGPADLPLSDLGSDGRGGARVRFALARDGVPVDGGDVVVVLPANERAPIVVGAEPPSGTVEKPRLDAAQASQAALAALAGRGDAVVLVVEPSPRLVALPRAGGLVPAWRVVVSGELDGRFVRRELYIDARTGAVTHEREGLRGARAQGSGLGVLGERRALDVNRLADGGYQLRDDTRGAHGIRTSSAAGGWRLPGRLVASADPNAWDEVGFGTGAAVDAHAHAATTVDWLEQSLGRDSWDGEGGAVRLVVHYGARLDNAFWDGRRAVFGDGDGVTSRPYAAALDVVAHELFHGVIDSEVGLVYEAQPGAIAESLADVFGSLVEADAGAGNWKLGEKVADPPLRDLFHPSGLGQPDHMDDYLALPPTPDDDMGGVHFNSTIPSHVAALLAEGGRHRLTGLVVPRLGRAAVRDLWWRALTIYLTPRARFTDLARATLLAAADLHGDTSPEHAAVETAWRAVGVLP